MEDMRRAWGTQAEERMATQAEESIPGLDLYGETHITCVAKVAEQYPMAEAAKLLEQHCVDETERRW